MRSRVPSQRVGISERLPARVACERLFVAVYSEVARKVPLQREPLRANRARVPLDAVVDELVALQVALGAERFLARGAAERLAARVAAPMDREVGRLREAPRARRARETFRLRAGVRLHFTGGHTDWPRWNGYR